MIRHSFTAALLGSLLAGSASAQGLFSFDAAEGGAFVSGHVGTASPGDTELSGAGTNLDAEFDSSATYGISAGYRLPFKYWTYFQPRLELEVSASEADLSDLRLNGQPRTGSGEVSTTYFLLNNYNDITWAKDQTLVPFLGGGIGFANIDLSLQEAATPGGAPGARINDDTSALATTFAGGLTWHFSEQFELYGEARYATIYGAEFDRLEAGAAAARPLDDDLSATTFTVGARLNF